MENYLNEDILTNVEVSVEVVTPAMAAEYISRNFEHNRKISEPKVKDLTTEMINGRFYLGDSALCFNEQGDLINGQHRLNALINCDEPQVFIIARNMPDDSLKIMDIGSRRDAADRITLNGVSISRREQAVIKHCMTPFNSGVMGVQKYFHNRHDNEVADYFTKTKYFFDCCSNHHILTTGQKYKTFIVCAALKIFLQMKKDKVEYPHGMSPIDRAFHFMYVTNNQVAVEHPINQEYDRSALVLKQSMDSFKEDTQGAHWNTPDCYRKTTNLAHYFMQGTSITRASIVKHDKFDDFDTLVRYYCTSS
jgi:hypothetical protein|tara:strand:- start:11 stop:931 length:921 start_codon:yes stop_codon:yes gene_type:complete